MAQVSAFNNSVSSERFNPPWNQDRSDTNQSVQDMDYYSSLGFYSIAIYQKLISHSTSSGCPCYPSCSHYMQEAIIQYGLFPGIVLGLDRLIRESTEIQRQPLINTPAGLKIRDPVSANTYWWNK